ALAGVRQRPDYPGRRNNGPASHGRIASAGYRGRSSAGGRPRADQRQRADHDYGRLRSGGGGRSRPATATGGNRIGAAGRPCRYRGVVMLMSLGSLSFEVWPLNPTETGRDSGGEYVEKAIMGRRPPLEFV